MRGLGPRVADFTSAWSDIYSARGAASGASSGAAVQLRRVVVGVDLRAPSMAAAAWCAKRLSPDAELILVHSVGPADTPDLDEARGSAWRDLRTLREVLNVGHAHIVVTEGDPAERIADVAARAGADLVVVGAHGDESTIWDALGTTAERLIRRTRVPVLITAGEFHREPKRLLVPVPANDIGESVLDWARMLEARFDASVAIVHVTEDDADRSPEPSDTVQPPVSASHRWRRLADGRGPEQIFQEAVAGEPAPNILAEAKRFHSDLIVLARDASDRPQRCDPTNDVTARVLRGAACPVLVVVEQGAC
jgi:nucleotide-binding universal stress UspA family protein